MKPVFFIILYLFFSTSVCAQPKEPVKWKDISMDEMKMKQYDPAPNAPAVVLFDYGKRYFDINPNGKYLFFFMERIVRIKILNEEGIKYAHIQIPFHDIQCEKYFSEGNIELYARSYNLDKDGKIVSTRLKFKNVQFRDSTDCYRIVEFTIPNVKAGSVIEYKYKIPTLQMIYPKSWYFQKYIPVKYSEFRLFVPLDFQYMVSSQNVEYFNINDVHYYTKDIFKPSTFYNSGVEHFDLSGKVFRFVMKDVPAFDCKGFIYKPENYMAKLNIHLLKILQRNQSEEWKRLTYPLMITTNDYYYTKTPEQRRTIPYPAGYINLTGGWEAINAKMLKHHRFGMPLILPWKDEGALLKITNHQKPDKQKIIDIYNYLRKEMKWDSTYSIYVKRVFDPFIGKMYSKISGKFINERSLRKPFEAKKGSNIEINFILIHFLRRMGLKADPVLVSTRDNGMIDTNIHDVDQFNHLVVRTVINQENIYLDATDSLRPYNFLKKNSIGVTGFLLSENGHEWVTVDNKSITKKIITSELKINENGTISGTVKNKLNGYDDLDLRRSFSKKTSGPEIVSTAIKNTQISDIEFKNMENTDKNLIINAKINIPNKNSNKIEFIPQIDIKFNEDDFTESIRKCPVELDYPFEYQYAVKITYPENYMPEYPDNLELKMFADKIQFIYKIEDKNGILTLNINYALRKNRFPADAYYKLANFTDKINSKLNEKITFTKIK